jgi:hypothetical protein
LFTLFNHSPKYNNEINKGIQMTNNTDEGSSSNTEKDTKDWVTGGEPATGAQESYVHTLAEQANEEVPEDLTKAEASDMIGKLQDETGRGKSS